MTNGMLTLSVGRTQHAATAAATALYGDVALDTNSADTAWPLWHLWSYRSG